MAQFPQFSKTTAYMPFFTSEMPPSPFHLQESCLCPSPFPSKQFIRKHGLFEPGQNHYTWPLEKKLGRSYVCLLIDSKPIEGKDQFCVIWLQSHASWTMRKQYILFKKEPLFCLGKHHGQSIITGKSLCGLAHQVHWHLGNGQRENFIQRDVKKSLEKEKGLANGWYLDAKQIWASEQTPMMRNGKYISKSSDI